jgi:hypothetical protein
MIESLAKKDWDGQDEHGLPLTTTYLYLVGVTQGFGTSRKLQGTTVFGEGEIATQKLEPDDHLGFRRFKRRHAGGSRNDGYRFDSDFSDTLPGARRRGISEQVKGLLAAMPIKGYNRCGEGAFNLTAVYQQLAQDGFKAAANASKSKFQAGKDKMGWDIDKWKAELKRNDAWMKGPTPRAQAVREAYFIYGVAAALEASKITGFVVKQGTPPVDLVAKGVAFAAAVEDVMTGLPKVALNQSAI